MMVWTKVVKVEVWSYSQYIMQVEPKRLADGLYCGEKEKNSFPKKGEMERERWCFQKC